MLGPYRFEEVPRAVPVDVPALVEIRFGFSRNDGRQQENNVGAQGCNSFRLALFGDVAGHSRDGETGLQRSRIDNVMENKFFYIGIGNSGAGNTPRRLLTKHTGTAEDEDFHVSWFPFVSAGTLYQGSDELFQSKVTLWEAVCEACLPV